jgi:hypothetical protein
MSVIILQVIGGLGNQMFQFAAGRALSIARNAPLLLDVGDFAGYQLHQGFELDRVFSCPVKLAEAQEIYAILGWQSSRLARRFFAHPSLFFLRSRHFIIEPHFHHWPGVSDLSLPCYMMGYWQTERYFAKVASRIRADFTFRQCLTGSNFEIAQEIKGVNAVSLHIRRGDYASNPKTLSTHGICSLAYYEAAIRYIIERVEAPHFFVFSDDMDWARENLNIDLPCRYVDNNHGAESYNDMRLMSLCRHHIIANSSFSWWGAWLNPHDDKVVVAPKSWFANSNNTNDLLPKGWSAL